MKLNDILKSRKFWFTLGWNLFMLASVILKFIKPQVDIPLYIIVISTAGLTTAYLGFSVLDKKVDPNQNGNK